MKFPFPILSKNDFDVVGFGTNAVDYLIRVPEYPKFNSKIELSEYSLAAGGEIASSMVGLTRLGLKTTYVGRFGADQAGELGMKSLIDEGVDVSHAQIIKDAQTQVAFAIIDERSGERTILWQRDSRLAFTDIDTPVDVSSCGRVLHMTPHDTLACIKMARSAKENGVIVSIDVDNTFDGIEELLPLVDICIGSSDFPSKLLGITDNKSAMQELAAQFGCPVVGVTLGESGSLFLCLNTFIATDGFEVPGECVDTTGAGDAFRTGFLFGLLTGRSVEESAEIANAVAALKCCGIGARSSLPDKMALEAFTKKKNRLK